MACADVNQLMSHSALRAVNCIDPQVDGEPRDYPLPLPTKPSAVPITRSADIRLPARAVHWTRSRIVSDTRPRAALPPSAATAASAQAMTPANLLDGSVHASGDQWGSGSFM